MKKLFLLFFISIGVVCLNSCNSDIKLSLNKKNLIIAISKASGSESYEQYSNWIKQADSSLIVVDLYNLPIDSVLKVLKVCDGILLSGGEDVNPDYYGGAIRRDDCGKIDYKRDTLEFVMMDYAFKNKMPVLGICRGQQIINVFLGGSLIIDLPKDHPSNVFHRCERADTCKHLINIAKNSLLDSLISGENTIQVNTSHHQAIEIPAINIEPLAISSDSIIEAIGWTKPENRSFLLGVQFHPEHLDFNHPLSGSIAKKMVEEMKKYKLTKSESILNQ